MLHWEVDDALASPAEVRALARCCAPKHLERLGISFSHTETGVTAEVPLQAHRVVAAVAERLAARLGLPGAPLTSLRLRDCGVGEGHPPHHDDYAQAGRRLVATGVVYLDACEGGRTRFPRADLAVEPRPGRGLLWLNLDAAGTPEPQALHDMEPVARGRRRALFLFAYATAEEVAAAHASAGDALLGRLPALQPWPPVRTLHLVVGPGLPETTTDLLLRAAARRRLAVELHDPAATPLPPRLPDGDLLYCPSTSAAAAARQRQLWHPGLGTFYRQARGPFAEVVDQLTLFTVFGLPVPRSEVLDDVSEPAVDAAIARLGGLPVILKLGGGEGGHGVMRLDTRTSLLSVLDGLALRGIQPLLQACIPDAVHWRLVVVGDEVVASYRNVLRSDGFRTYASEDLADYTAEPPPGAARLAVAAAAAIQVGLAGVDLLAHPSGRLYLLEANFPCYFPQAQVVAGVDVAGAMLDWLLASAGEPRREDQRAQSV
ncbi:MAG: hypothetical protein H6706_19030 [Myxococcales bacterium]|nr:hypothetical protein [Myxococcales bacterium]